LNGIVYFDEFPMQGVAIFGSVTVFWPFCPVHAVHFSILHEASTVSVLRTSVLSDLPSDLKTAVCQPNGHATCRDQKICNRDWLNCNKKVETSQSPPSTFAEMDDVTESVISPKCQFSIVSGCWHIRPKRCRS
jgi:hypothetical protein